MCLECVPAKSVEICEKCQNTMQCKAPFKCCPITKLCVLNCNTDCKDAEKAICHPPCKDDMDPTSCQCLSSKFPFNWGKHTCLWHGLYFHVLGRPVATHDVGQVTLNYVTCKVNIIILTLFAVVFCSFSLFVLPLITHNKCKLW